MQHIPTSATALRKIKDAAKQLKNSSAVAHAQALELVAQQFGYESWFHVQWCFKQPTAANNAQTDNAGINDRDRFLAKAHTYMEYLARKGSVPVNRYPTRGDVFHEVEIEGICFRGAVGIGGPAIIRRTARLRGHEQGWVQLGVAEIHCVPRPSPYLNQAEQTAPVGHEWWVCKYGASEERIKIDDLSPAGRHALAHEFGIVLYYPLRDDYSRVADPDALHFACEWFPFYLSPAFQSLCAWARKHPRKATLARGSYLRDWPEAAAAGQYVFHDSGATVTKPIER